MGYFGRDVGGCKATGNGDSGEDYGAGCPLRFCCARRAGLGVWDSLLFCGMPLGSDSFCQDGGNGTLMVVDMRFPVLHDTW